MDGHHLPTRPHRAPRRETDRGRITPPRLPPSAWFPAGRSGYRVSTVALSNGTRLRVVETGDANGRAVVLLHGWACSAYSFANLMEPLAAAGFRAIVIELPGHSLSDKPLDSSEYTLKRMTDSVVEVLMHVGIDRFAAVGHSMGTAIALDLASRHPQRVGTIVLVSPLGLDSIRITAAAKLLPPGLVQRLLPAAVPRIFVKTTLRAVYGRRRQPSERDVDMYWAPTAFPAYGYAMIALLREFEWRAWADDALAAIGTPALLVCGALDPLVRHEIVVRRSVLMAGSRTVVLEGTGHVALAEAPEEIVPVIVQFIQQRAT